MKKAGLYIHIPFCKVKCVYCDFYSITKQEDQIPLFTKCIINEIESYKNYNGEWEFNTIFFGGGTPSILPARYLEQILKKLHDTFDTSNIKEITLEANPGEAPLEYLKDIRNLGVNRLSMGFQSFNDKILKQLGRLHKSQDCFKTFKNARKAGFENINTDMIFNIPGLSSENWKEDLNTIIELNPEHISAYSLTVEPETKLFNLVKNKKILMPIEKIDIEQFLLTNDILTKHGYYQYEISNYSKEKMESMHNLHYWNLSPYLSFGPSAHSYNLKERWWNVKSLEKYIKQVINNKSALEGKENLSRIDNFNEIILNGLRLKTGIRTSDLNNYNDLIDKTYIKKINEKWDCLSVSNDRIRLIDNGFLFVDEITKDLFI